MTERIEQPDGSRSPASVVASGSEPGDEAPRAAVIGTGFIGPVHVEALRRAGVHVTGILGSSAAKSRAAAARLGLPRGYETLDELLADDAVESVHITSPNRFHYEQTVAALAAGKHVLCEKPLAMEARESQDLVERAAASDRVTGVAYNLRFYPLCREAAGRIRSEEFGRTLHVTGSYTQDWLLNDTDYNWRVAANEGGSLRAVADIGTHWLDLVQAIVGQPVTAVLADLQTVHEVRHRPVGGRQTFTADAAEPAATEPVAIATEDAGCVLLRFAGGARGSLHVSQTTAGRKNCLRWEIAGSRRSLAFNSERPNVLWIGSRDTANEQLVRDPALLSPAAASIASYPGGHNEGFPDTFKHLMIAFYAATRGAGRESCGVASFADGHRELLLCEAILQSHREERWVAIDSSSRQPSQGAAVCHMTPRDAAESRTAGESPGAGS